MATGAPDERRARRRHRRRLVLIVLLVLAAVAGIVLWRLARDGERLTNFLLQQARDRFALDIALDAPARFEFVPDLALRIDGVTARAVGSPEILFTAKQLAARVPWSALWASTLRIDGLVVQSPTVHLGPFAGWLATVASASDGPPPPLRWPSVESHFEIRDARLLGDEGAAVLGPFDLAFEGLHADQSWSPRVSWRNATHVYTLVPTAIVRDTATGLALDSLEATLVATPLADAGAVSRTTLQGRVAFDSAAAWSADLHVVAAQWPTWLPAIPSAVSAPASTPGASTAPGTAGAVVVPASTAALDLTLRLISGGASAIAIVADGQLGGTRLSTSLVGDAVPDFSQPWPALLDDIARHWRGRATVPSLHVGDVAIEGLEVVTGDVVTPTDTAPEPR